MGGKRGANEDRHELHLIGETGKLLIGEAEDWARRAARCENGICS
jgi:hypothetical protein